MAGKQEAHEFAANHADIQTLLFVVPIEPAPLVNGLIADAVELWFRTVDVAVAAAELAYEAKISAVDYGRGVPDVGRIANVDVILVIEEVVARRKLAAPE